MFGNIGAAELIIILVLALIIFGPGKLPEVGKAIGRSIREFKRAQSGLEDDENGTGGAKSPLRTSPAPENPVSEPEAEAAGALAGPLGQLVAMLEEEGEALVEHLEELRIRLLIFAGAFLAAAWVGWLAAPRVLAGFQQAVGRLIFVAPAEAFMTRLRIAGALGLLLSLPVGIYQAWRFVAPALFPEEKRLACLFVLGRAASSSQGGPPLGTWVVYPVSLSFFLRLGTEGLRPAVVVSQHLSFFLAPRLVRDRLPAPRGAAPSRQGRRPHRRAAQRSAPAPLSPASSRRRR